jgi:nucleotide-binding universal stress UspA family protein
MKSSSAAGKLDPELPPTSGKAELPLSPGPKAAPPRRPAGFKGALRAGTLGQSHPAAAQPAKPLNILVPMDFSQPSGNALQAAGSFARRYGGRITLVTVIEPSAMMRFETETLAADLARSETHLKNDLGEWGRKLVSNAHLAGVLVRHGRPFEEITKAARTLASDLIIMATHGHTGFKRVLLGSTAERVIRVPAWLAVEG